MTTRTPMKPVYSGPQSRVFWNRINAVKPWYVAHRLYARGVTLQNKEERLLHELAEAELPPRRKVGKR